MTNYIDSTTAHPDGAQLKHARQVARLSLSDAALLCGIHRTTLARQEAGTSRVSLAAYRLLLSQAGYLPAFAAWQGWRLDTNAIWSPDGVQYGVGEIRALPYLHALISELQREARGQAADKVAPLPLPNRAIR